MVRLDSDDERLVKKPLLFLVGEVRRDVIPKTLMDKGLGGGKVGVEEVEVYGTRERASFETELGEVLEGLRGGGGGV
jgi:uroporphyrinogen-III synthase